MSASRHGQLVVLDAEGAYRGVLSARALADALADGEHDEAKIASLTEMPATVAESDLLENTLDVLETAHGAVPVLDAARTHLVDWLTHQRVLAAQRHPDRPTSGAQDPE